MEDLKLLVISHYFPPVPGVGGRRWAKFVKYLSRLEGVQIDVISAENTVKDVSSSFEKELEDVNFNHTILPSNYPSYLEFLEFAKPSLWGKVMFRVQLRALKKQVKGNYWDFSVLWKAHFDKVIPTIIEKRGIQKVIVSGPPYRYIEYAVGLKKVFPQLEVILDYRDPWNDFNDPFPISEERHVYERALEKDMLMKVDKIITVSEFQKQLILQNQPQASPVIVLPNGFDMEDYQTDFRPKAVSDKIRFVHFGTLHFLKDYYWKPFFNAFERLKREKPALYTKIQIDLVGYCPIQIQEYIEQMGLNVMVHGILDPFKAYSELNQADIALWFKYDGSPGDFATKFGDYISLNKYMWTFSVKGAVTDHIEAHKIGSVFYRDQANLEDHIFEAFLAAEDPNNWKFNPDYDASKLQINNLTKDLLAAIRK